MYKVKNFIDNDDVKVLDKKGAFSIIEYQRDMSVTPETAIIAYYSAQMNVKRRQLLCDVSASNIVTQSGQCNG